MTKPFARKLRYAVLGLLILALGSYGFFLVDKISSEYELAAQDFKTAVWHASQLEFAFSSFFQVLDRYGNGDATVSHDDLGRSFDRLGAMFEAHTNGINSAEGADIEALAKDMNTLRQLFVVIAPGIAEMSPGDTRAYADMRATFDFGLQPLQRFIAEAEAQNEASFDEAEAGIKPFYWYLGSFAVATVFTFGVLIFFLIQEIIQTNRAEAQMRVARDIAEEATRAKSQFLAMMSHEIRTPMNGVLGMLTLLRETRLHADQTNYVSVASNSAHALLGVINDILDFSKLEADRLDLEEIPFQLSEVVEGVTDLLATRAHDKDIEIGSVVMPDLPSTALGDPNRLRQIILNLAGNAIKFTEDGGVIIKVSPAPSEDDPYLTRFEIIDTGIGIPEDRKSALFSEFTQVDASTSRKYGGTGLGLAISKRLSEMMHGGVGFDSVLGEGSTFWFTARLAPAPEAETKPAPEQQEWASQPLLVVTTNTVFRDVVSAFAQAGGGQFMACETVADALTRAKSMVSVATERPLLVVADATLPDEGAAVLVKAMRGDQAFDSALMVIAESFAERAALADWAELGFDRYLVKPLRTDSRLRAFDEDDEAEVGGATKTVVAKRGRILLVDDTSVNQMVGSSMLRGEGYTVEIADCGEAAITQATDNDFHLILMDLHMPDMSGLEATQRILSDIDNPPPIVALTADVIQEHKQECFDAGMVDFIAKPIDKPQMMTIVEKWIGDGALPDENAPVVPAASDADQSAEQTAKHANDTDSGVTPSDARADTGGPATLPAEPPKAETQSAEAAGATEDSEMADGIPILDLSVVGQLRKDVGEEIFLSLLSEFTEDVGRRLEIIVACDGSDLETTGREAHSLASSSGTFGGRRLEKIARTIEYRCMEDNLSPTPDQIAALSAEADRTVTEMRQAVLAES